MSVANGLAQTTAIPADDIGPDARGYVRLYRKILDSAVFASATLLKVFVWCMAKATHRPINVAMRTGRGATVVSLNVGQFVTGRKVAAVELGMPESTVNDLLHRLADLGCISIQPNTHFSVITVCNYSTYQDGGSDDQQATRHPSNNQPTGKQQPSDTHPTHTNTINTEAQKHIDSSRRALRFDADDLAFANYVWNRVQAIQPTRQTPDLDRWANSVRLAREADGRTLADLRAIFDVAHADSFWQTNILSPDKLRAKFDDLDLKLRKRNPAHGNGRHAQPGAGQIYTPGRELGPV